VEYAVAAATRGRVVGVICGLSYIMGEEKRTDFIISTRITSAVVKALTCYFDQKALR
jgi:hypothetical protein